MEENWDASSRVSYRTRGANEQSGVCTAGPRQVSRANSTSGGWNGGLVNGRAGQSSDSENHNP